MPLRVDIVTPDRVVVDGQPAELVVVPGEEGDLGFEEGHALLLASLRVGRIRIFPKGPDAGEEQVLATSGGFVEVWPDRVVVLAGSVEKREEIDTERARQALRRAEKLLEGKPEGIDVARAKAALARARNRLQVAGQ
jgi:F-type H+-transporting ATPase subunit epsilon